MNYRTILSIIAILLTSQIANCQTHIWERTNPGGGGAYSTIGASASGIIIAGSDLSGAYRSLDNGASWDVIGAYNGLTETHISGVGFHRYDGQILYIGTENGIFRSDDGGSSCNSVLNSGYITDIEFGTNNSDIGYASYHASYDSNNGVIYKSNNNGLDWNQVSTNLPSGIRILKIIINPLDANELYILTGEGRFACGPADVFKSIDGGATWSNITNSLDEVLDIALDPNTPSRVYITTMNASCSAPYYWTDVAGSLYKSSNSGNTWDNPLSNNTGVIFLDPNNPNTIRLIDPREPFPWNTNAGTFTSNDGGSTFTRTGDVEDWDTFFTNDLFRSYGTSFNGISKTLGEDLSNPNSILWVNSQWVFRSTDNGSTFNNIFTDEISPGFWRSRGFDNVNMLDISISGANPDIVYAAYFDIGIWRSLDKGASWQNCNDVSYSGDWEGYGGNCATVIADPNRENVVWASLSENQNGEDPTYLLKNMNTGEKNSWSLSNSGLPTNDLMGLSLDKNSPTDNRTLYITASKDVYKSIDDGLSWVQVLDCNGCRFTAIDHYNSDIVYAGGELGMWRSIDGGTNWTDISDTQMLSNPGAEFWDYNYSGIYDITTDPNNPNYVYTTAVGDNKGLFKSTNNGDNWTKILTDDYMRKVAIVPTNSDQLYATSSSAVEAGGYYPNSSGIQYSDDGGNTWSQQNQDMAYPFALAIDIDNMEQATVFVGSPGTGFQKSNVPESNVSIIENTINHFSYPNPTNGKITITLTENESNDIGIYNILGETVLSEVSIVKLSEKSIELDLSTLPSGSYILRLKTSAMMIYKL